MKYYKDVKNTKDCCSSEIQDSDLHSKELGFPWSTITVGYVLSTFKLLNTILFLTNAFLQAGS